jgi:outer membrane protein TolC
MQPYYLHEDGDLSHYLDTANEIDFPDVEHASLEEVTKTLAPLTIRNADFDTTWDLSLEEAIATALHNSKVIRTFGQIRQFGQFVTGPAERLASGPDSVGTVYDVAIQETGQGGVEQVLSNFDAVFNSSATWESFDRVQNFRSGQGTQTPLLQQDQVSLTNEISKQSASGAQYFLRNTSTYTGANSFITAAPRAVPSDWFTTIETEIRQPLLRNRGTQVNRIPVVLARIRTDVSLSVFEIQVMSLLSEVERAYWELYFFYYNLEAATIGRDSALGIWRRVYAKFESGAPGGEAEQEAQAREQYFTFRFRVESEKNNVLKSETRLRFLLGLSSSDGRLIRPADLPTTAEIRFDWPTIHREALMRSPVLRQQRWQIKRRELELIAARNQLLPRLDAVGLYRWTGAGDKFNSDRPPTVNPPPNASTFPSGAIQNLLDGGFQEFRIGAELEIPLGFRRELSQVRNQQLLLARERARLKDMELEVTHVLDDAVKELDAQYQLLQTSMNRAAAAHKQVESVEAAFDAGTVVLDLLLDAQRRRADAQAAAYQALVQYNLAIVTMHFRKGSIFEYNNIMLAEGPWPAKAYFDAQNAARQRDASYCINYGYSRPDVISRGLVENNTPAPADPDVQTADPYPAESRIELVPRAADTDDGTSGEYPLQPDTGDEELPPPPRLDEGFELPAPDGDIGTPPPLDAPIEAHRPSRTARRAPTPDRQAAVVEFRDTVDVQSPATSRAIYLETRTSWRLNDRTAETVRPTAGTKSADDRPVVQLRFKD